MSFPKPDARTLEEARFGLAVATAGIGMALIDLQQRWLEVNPAFEQMLGYRTGDLAGHDVHELLAGDDTDAHSSAAFAALIKGEQALADLPQRYRHRDGRVVRVQAHIVVVRDPAGAVQSLLLQLHEIGRHAGERISERSPNEAAMASSAKRSPDAEPSTVQQALLEQRAHALEAANRQLQLFADAVSHDLRAPLRSIESFSALLAQRCLERLDDAGRDQLGRIRSAASRMSGLLDSLGDLSYATRTQIRPAAVDLSLLADWVIAELQDADPGHEVTVQVQPGLQAHGDERLLKLMLGQLIGNAWKFSRSSATPRIEIGGQSDAGVVQLFVRDAGCGFDMRYAHKLFEPFQRLHGPEKGGGHGLGLTIAQRIAERHGGGIHAESTPGAGSTFHVDLPAPGAAVV